MTASLWLTCRGSSRICRSRPCRFTRRYSVASIYKGFEFQKRGNPMYRRWHHQDRVRAQARHAQAEPRESKSMTTNDTVGKNIPSPKLVTAYLSKEIEQSADRPPDERIKAVQIFENHYRCNWWMQDKSPHSFRLATGTWSHRQAIFSWQFPFVRMLACCLLRLRSYPDQSDK